MGPNRAHRIRTVAIAFLMAPVDEVENPVLGRGKGSVFRSKGWSGGQFEIVWEEVGTCAGRGGDFR